MLNLKEMDFLNELAVNAGKSIMEVYSSTDLGVEIKEDDSPLTKADKASHSIIVTALKTRFPDIPVISEEDTFGTAYETRKNY